MPVFHPDTVHLDLDVDKDSSSAGISPPPPDNSYCARPVEMDCHFESICEVLDVLRHHH